MGRERSQIDARFKQLLKQAQIAFPAARESLVAPVGQGVYVIRDSRGTVLHVGRTLRRKGGLYSRLYDHLYGKSSFVFQYPKFQGDGSKLRVTHTYQTLSEPNDRMRVLLEAHAVSQLCPKHLGTGGDR
jgi:hypothetical protein